MFGSMGNMTEPTEWVLFAYRMPREPSTPRISVWRKLRKLGAVQLVDGLVTLPASTRTREEFDWLADEVQAAGGEAWTWLAVPSSKAEQRRLAAAMRAAAAEEYGALIAEAERLRADGGATPRTIEKLRRELRRIGARDHFPPREREVAQRAVERLATELERAAR